ncbi:MAG: dolichyl-phosphate beta-D-mannosyltransferase [Candidatus Kerfeldbacteria bacterium CG08_land_8_20_14_0_20_40_16]|uniref:Dolichyl-phosphate beta-D-mannosyltransferase n=1 Tax=Candidatus Kerfeldbacteria bacterium CG08_land_8_20_14_0_20_40_16 TaxID=2014244 RepID=A0A2H0YV91_9BACT|nr:MAG: dolichyl-phosphate beta-D-mannosyltransferase [Candidatus Kerfeldbacteria bacterium CG08_land_8_20_14_0_20_40_16]
MEKKYIILPTYNEKDNLTDLIEAILNLQIFNLHIIIVDDNSPDGTGRIADQLSQTHPGVSVIHREGKMGLGSAYITGFKRALAVGADLIFEMDADFSHNPKEIPNFIKAIQEGYDVVVGSRRIPDGGILNWGIARNIMSKGAMWFSRLVLGLKTKDVTSGYRCYSQKVIKAINWGQIKSNGYSFQEETIFRCEKMSFKVKEIPIVFRDRVKGKSKLSKTEILNFFLTIIRLRFKK